MLVSERPSLFSHIREKYEHAGKSVFEDVNAWEAVSSMLINILEDPDLNCVYILIDALDECTTDLPKLLDFIVQRSSTPSRVKWIVSSRNWPNIEEQLGMGYGVKLSLELNASSISMAVGAYIQYKVAQLGVRKYNDEARQFVLDYMSSNAQDTFLWVALVCQNLKNVPKWKVRDRLSTFPPGLDAVYGRMMRQITSSDDADLSIQILAIAATVYQPITTKELATLVEQIQYEADDPESISEIIGYCGSFLTLRDDTVYFVHQSAKDYICKTASHEIFPSGKDKTHRVLLSRSLHIMSSAVLHRDMYGLRKLGYPIEKIKQPDSDPLATVRYSCIYWIDHLCDCDLDSMPNAQDLLRDGGTIEVFLSTKYLYWLEALSLCRNMSKGVISMRKLANLIKVPLRQTNTLCNPANLEQNMADVSALNKLIYDAHRFIMYHKTPIDNWPLQTYASALLFSPTRSLIRQIFEHEAPNWVTISPRLEDKWGVCIKTLESHTSGVRSAVFSHDSKQLASATSEEIKVWDVVSGQCLYTIHCDLSIDSVAFSHDSKQIAAVSRDGTAFLYNAIDGKGLLTLEGLTTTEIYFDSLSSIKFSYDSTLLASTSAYLLTIWKISSGTSLQLWWNNYDSIISVSFSYDSKRLASGTSKGSINIWAVDSGTCVKELKLTKHFSSVVFFEDLTKLVSSSKYEIAIWNVNTGECLQTFNIAANSLALFHASINLASVLSDSFVNIWDITTGECLQTFGGHSGHVTSVLFSHDSKHLASASADKTIKIWDLSQDSASKSQDENGMLEVYAQALCSNSAQLALITRSRQIEIWNKENGQYLCTLATLTAIIREIRFSPNSTRIASVSCKGTVQIWDPRTGSCLKTILDYNKGIRSIAFSPDSTRVVLSLVDRTCKEGTTTSLTYSIWDTNSCKCLKTFEARQKGLPKLWNPIAISNDPIQHARTPKFNTVAIWDMVSSERTHGLKHQESDGDIVSIVFSKTGNQLASATDRYIIKIWDVNNAECLHTLKCTESILQMNFDFTGSYLHTERGTIDICASSLADAAQISTGASSVRYRGLRLEYPWIVYNSENLIWVPSEFRGKFQDRACVADKVIVINDGSQRMWMYNFDLEQLSKAQVSE
jgi:WD40 repeat protein